jgi:phosphopantothenoylcysteine decarboxylase / phosphopantothenate---cysteine ligase
MLTHKRILLIIGGGIAAYKSLDLIRQLSRRGAHVRCIMTKAASAFVTPLTVAGLSGEKVYQDLFSLLDETEMGHIALSRAADLVVVAPATAHLMARMVQGAADDLATTALLATDKKILLAPAMNVRMWLHPATQRNLTQLQMDGVTIIGPNEGAMACGEFGPGRMAEPLEIVAAIETMFESSTSLPLPYERPASDNLFLKGLLAGRRVLITAGPTHEAIDPVRYIANRSSGKQGYALAAAAASAGADVTLISGPTHLPDPFDVKVVRVKTALEMLAAVERILGVEAPLYDAAIFTAAVADWRVEVAASEKIKKDKSDPKQSAPVLKLLANPDILATIAQRGEGRPLQVIGFAAETNDVIAHAQQKLDRKGCDMIIANDVSAAGGVMGGDHNSVHLITREGVESWPLLSKDVVAKRLILRLAAALKGAS